MGGGWRECYPKGVWSTKRKRQETGPGGRRVVRVARPPPYFSLQSKKQRPDLECEFRRDSIKRCFCCWRLVRPPGAPAAEEAALLVRGKSQLILLGSPGPRP